MRARIRLAQDDDAEAIGAIYRPMVEATPISFETTAPNRGEMARRIAETLRSHPWLVCDVDGHVAGYAYATRHREREAYRWSVETSAYVGETHRRLGVGRGLYMSLLAILGAQGYANAYAGIVLPNAGSVALHESVGFEPIGVFRRVGYKMGAWHDVGWWQASLPRQEGVPSEPRVLATVMETQDWEGLVERGQSIVRAGASRRGATT